MCKREESKYEKVWEYWNGNKKGWKLKFLPVFLSITYLMCIFASVLGNLINESFKNIRE